MSPVLRIARNGFLVAAIVLAANIASANDAAGVFLTAADYQSGRLTDRSDCKSSANHKVELHDVVNKPYIHVTHDGATRQYLKADIYGFRSCNGRDFRFVGNRVYEILESREASIYVVRLPDREGEDLVVGPTKQNAFFFSAGASGPVLPLTSENLKRAFRATTGFTTHWTKPFETSRNLPSTTTFTRCTKSTGFWRLPLSLNHDRRKSDASAPLRVRRAVFSGLRLKMNPESRVKRSGVIRAVS